MKFLMPVLQLPRSMKRLVSLLADAIAILVALIVAHVLAYLYQPPSDLLRWAFLYVALTIGSLAVFTKLGLYRAVVRYVSFRALGSVLVGVLSLRCGCGHYVPCYSLISLGTRWPITA
ncbi:hypothetical protein [Pseudidiomarina marina]|uniref:hypothetical protein n=1 Tax=Pseudidiomarina marina TaxID=502366 RepID=UPI001F54659F|nr:hypothetical protein [Pseudidiomarina marina]